MDRKTGEIRPGDQARHGGIPVGYVESLEDQVGEITFLVSGGPDGA